MTTYLADSSLWIDYLRRDDSPLHAFIRENTAGHTEPVAMELLAGTRRDQDTVDVERLLLRSPLVRFDSASDFAAATEFRRSALREGLGVGIVDCMILAVAARTQVPLLTLDRAQAALARVHGVAASVPAV